jgi:hypothetical protein
MPQGEMVFPPSSQRLTGGCCRRRPMNFLLKPTMGKNQERRLQHPRQDGENQ